MFVCGMSSLAGGSANVASTLERVDKVIEDPTVAEDQKIISLYQSYSQMRP